MSAAGLATRGTAPGNARETLVTLTARGVRRCDATARRRREALQHGVLDRLPADRRETVVSALRQLVVAMHDGAPLDEDVWPVP